MAEKRPKQRLRRPYTLLRDTNGATAIEYGILMMMIGLALLGMMTLTDVSNQISNTFNSVSDTLSR
ncbi:Flp family type IVb pilin [Pleomorphomonas sp. PLEO]|uniref:Flp family type IVb pilin n=1 Tax=Pleomorphomonas sp. PLEO TaxID=3239306 RepID=UPI00351F0D73